MAKVNTDEWLDIAVMGIGAGAKGAVTGLVQQFLPDIGAEIGGIIAGGLLYMYGDRVHPLLQKFGAGVLISAIGGFTENLIPQLNLGLKSSSGSSNTENSNVTSLEALAAAEAQKSIDQVAIL